MIKHYKGILGEFDYDDEEFKIVELDDTSYIHYIGKGLSVDLPKGCINTSKMFTKCKLPEGFHLGDFGTSNVKDMRYMFASCNLPKEFTLGDKFNTSNVKNMKHMFYECEFSDVFSLGNHFDTSNVIDMSCMFAKCIFPEGFSLGDKFDTSNVEDMNCMFYECRFNKRFNFGSKFKTNKAIENENIVSIFNYCKLMPYNINIDDYLYDTLIKEENDA